MSDLFKFFDKMNTEDYDYVDQMDEEEIKKMSPYVMSMWINGAQTNQHMHIILTNLYCNEHIFSLAKYPRLLLKLFIAANGGIDNARYKFTKALGTKETDVIKYVAKCYNCSYENARGYVKLLSDEDIKEILSIYEES